jgi:hypothetical protein
MNLEGLSQSATPFHECLELSWLAVQFLTFAQLLQKRPRLEPSTSQAGIRQFIF